jgi:hypothetical protein
MAGRSPMGEITDAIKRFIADHITSVDQLEVLLLLHRTAEREWTAAAVSRELRIDAEWAARRLDDLQVRGFLSAMEGEGAASYRWAPATADLARGVEAVAAAYAERRVSVTTLIFAQPSSTIRTFANAFRFRKDRGDG